MTSQVTQQITRQQVEVLNSWKEIAQYLGRGVRTVQRWESTLGLPVRRPHGRGRSAVIAMRSELDRWLKSCPTRNGFENGAGPDRNGTGPKLEGALTVHEKATLELLLQSEQLRAHIRSSREELQGSIRRLAITLGKMGKASGRPARLAAENDMPGGDI